MGSVELTLWSLLPLLPLGIVAGLLSGLLGIGGGLLFSPLLLALGLPPHQALATSTLAIVPTTLGGTWAHLRSGQLPLRASLAIGLGAAVSGLLFSHWGRLWAGQWMLALQAALYLLLALVMAPQARHAPPWRETPRLLAGLIAVGLVAGAATGLLGLGGGLLMVPLMVRLLQIAVHQAIRLSTLAVLVSAACAAPAFVADERGLWPLALLLGGAAAAAAQWSASRLNRVQESLLVNLVRALALLLAIDSARRAVGFG
jgi:uncharacterized protein